VAEPVRKARFRGRAPVVFASVVFFPLLGLCAIACSTSEPTLKDLLRAHATAPSEETARRLFKALHNNRFGTREGSRALASVIMPKVIAREEYAAGRKIFLAIEHAYRSETFSLSAAHLGINGKTCEATLMERTPGVIPPLWLSQTSPHHEVWIDSARGGTVLAAIAHGLLPGQYQAGLTLSYEIPRYGKTLKVEWDPVRKLWNIPVPDATWVRARKSTPYKCDIKLPLSLTIKPAADVKKVQLKRGPQLDRAMRERFKCVAGDSARKLHLVGHFGDYGILVSPKRIEIGTLPEAVAFRVFLRDEKGTRHRLMMPRTASCALPPVRTSPVDILLRAGEKATLSSRLWAFFEPVMNNYKAPGTYRFTLVFEPDPDIAYMDPRIDSIWGGTLEFPLAMTIERRPDERLPGN